MVHHRARHRVLHHVHTAHHRALPVTSHPLRPTRAMLAHRVHLVHGERLDVTDNEVYKVYRATPGHKERRVHKVRRGLWEDRLAHRGFKAMLVLLVHKDLWDHKANKVYPAIRDPSVLKAHEACRDLKVHRETLARPGILAHPALLDIRGILERLA